ncbi:MAG: hypothetical protein KF729_35355 [Sandaracinaceae bacterium]|nr:hypothetical protein [Sandaracinaceae bacterium]
MQQQYSFSVSLPDHQGQPVEVRCSGSVDRQGGAPGDRSAEAYAASALQSAAQRVLGASLAAGQVALPSLALSLPHFVPQILADASAQLAPSGVQLASLSMQCVVPTSATAPAAAAIAAAPTPMQALGSSLQHAAADQVASAIPSRVNVHVGGFKVGVGQGGVDTGGLADQAMNKVKSSIMFYVIGGAILLLVALLCCGSVAFKMLVG